MGYVTEQRRYNTKALDIIQQLIQYFEDFPVNVEEIIVDLRIILVCFQGNYFAHFTLMMLCMSTKAGL